MAYFMMKGSFLSPLYPKPFIQHWHFMPNLLAQETTSGSSGVRRQGRNNAVVYVEYRLGQQVYALASPTIQSSGPAQKL